MKQCLSALGLDRVLSPILTELAIKIGVIPVFRYSAGVVPWTKTEGTRADFPVMAGCVQACLDFFAETGRLAY